MLPDIPASMASCSIIAAALGARTQLSHAASALTSESMSSGDGDQICCFGLASHQLRLHTTTPGNSKYINGERNFLEYCQGKNERKHLCTSVRVSIAVTTLTDGSRQSLTTLLFRCLRLLRSRPEVFASGYCTLNAQWALIFLAMCKVEIRFPRTTGLLVMSIFISAFRVCILRLTRRIRQLCKAC